MLKFKSLLAGILLAAVSLTSFAGPFTDFAENKFSVVMEQYYFDWISNIRKSAIVKGPTFADVKAELADPES